jgi:hypothetical protein
MKRLLLALVSVGFFACSSASSPSASAPPPGPQDDGGTDSGWTPQGPGSYTLSFTTDPGQETHWCQYVRLPKGTADEVMLTGYRWKWEAMHHFALYRTTADLPADVSTDKPFDCFAPGGGKYMQPAAMTLEGEAEGQTTFGPGTGFGLKSEEIVVVQAHTLNTTQAPIQPKIELQLDLADPSAVPNRLGLIQFYDPFIVVPPHAAATAQMRCKIPRDMTVLRRSTHMHMRGVEVQVFLDAPGAALATTPIVSSTDWQHPPVVADALTLPKDSYVRTICKYQGDEKQVIQGQDKVDNEMCMFIGYYYPPIPADQGGPLFENCVQDGISGGVGDSYGTGATSCADTLACVQACPPGEAPNPHDNKIDVGPCFQKCMVDSCAAASEPFDVFGVCLQKNCASECGSSKDACTSCVTSKCVNEYLACQGAKCQ